MSVHEALELSDELPMKTFLELRLHPILQSREPGLL